MNARREKATAASLGRAPMDILERVVEWTILGMVAASVSLLVVGAVLALVLGEAIPRQVTPVECLWTGLTRFEPSAYTSLGIIALIATPFLRVAGSVATFAWNKQRRFAMLAALVLAIMATSVVLGSV